MPHFGALPALGCFRWEIDQNFANGSLKHWAMCRSEIQFDFILNGILKDREETMICLLTEIPMYSTWKNTRLFFLFCVWRVRLQLARTKRSFREFEGFVWNFLTASNAQFAVFNLAWNVFTFDFREHNLHANSKLLSLLTFFEPLKYFQMHS